MLFVVYSFFSSLSPFLARSVWFMFRLFGCMSLGCFFFFSSCVFFSFSPERFVFSFVRVSICCEFFNSPVELAVPLCKCYAAVRVLFSYLCLKEWHSKQQPKWNGRRRNDTKEQKKKRTNERRQRCIGRATQKPKPIRYPTTISKRHQYQISKITLIAVLLLLQQQQ